MNKNKLGLALAGIACICAVFVASASAFTEFRAKSVPTTIKGINKGTHEVALPGAPTFLECATVKSSAKLTKSKSPTQNDVVEYSACTAFGSLTATVSNAEYEFNANSAVTLLNTVTIKFGGCEDVLEPTPNRDLKAITYTNISSSNKEIELKANVTGITLKAPGGICGESGSKATYVGTSLVSEIGVDLEVV